MASLATASSSDDSAWIALQAKLEVATAEIDASDASLAAAIVIIESEEASTAKLNARIDHATGDSVESSYLHKRRDHAITRMGYLVRDVEHFRRMTNLKRENLNALKQEAGLLASVTG